MRSTDETVGRDRLLHRCMEKALRFLALRDRSSRELRTKLFERGFSESILDETIETLLERRFLDDTSYAVRRARYMAVEKLYGNRRIESNLREKGIDPEMISMAISNARTELDEKKGLARLIEKKIKTRPLSGLSAGDKRRLATSLLGRGFPPAFIYEALGRATEDFSE